VCGPYGARKTPDSPGSRTHGTWLRSRGPTGGARCCPGGTPADWLIPRASHAAQEPLWRQSGVAADRHDAEVSR